MTGCLVLWPQLKERLLASLEDSKKSVREYVWARLEQASVVEPGVRGHIPDFAGAAGAADLLAGLGAWRAARVVKVVPDRAQYPVRVRALRAGKLLYMAVPRLAEARPFFCLDPEKLDADPEAAADREIAARIAPLVSIDAMRPVDLVVCGSVAVSRSGARLGKGAGFSDVEMALLAEAGLLSDRTVIATTVHELQVLDGELPEEEHDFRVDLIVTPERAIKCESARRPAGLDWKNVTAEQLAAIPVLKQHLQSRRD
jgi:5-formyltetrahydrofolate cyclo-ligase